ncbi:DMT family transporter [Affinibrenneria salicis]|uniref:DMT family transporter n=1 Tax=Affinibrenneria salicis TaxID=2590031 RepID=A0A5J5FYL2_9GAMM|nr:DMT family transporter [Affinibrenneria salicis]KAA8998848.1 DMT family transporter [Affinibrenneria salicis]
MSLGQLGACLLAILAGAALPLQAGANAEMSRLVGYPLTAALVSALVSITLMGMLMLFFRVPLPAPQTLAQAPWWSWCGGAMGVAFLVLATLVAPSLGAATFIALAIAGQMGISVFFDHFALMGFPARPASLMRIIGAGMIVGGAVFVQRG